MVYGNHIEDLTGSKHIKLWPLLGAAKGSCFVLQISAPPPMEDPMPE